MRKRNLISKEPTDTYSLTHFLFLGKQTVTRYLQHPSSVRFSPEISLKLSLNVHTLLRSLNGLLENVMAFDSRRWILCVPPSIYLLFLRTFSFFVPVLPFLVLALFSRPPRFVSRPTQNTDSYMKVQTLKIQFPTNTRQIKERYLFGQWKRLCQYAIYTGYLQEKLVQASVEE